MEVLMVTKTHTKDEIFALEKRYWNALKAQDADTMSSVTDKTCLTVGPQGVRQFDQRTLSEMAKSSDFHLRQFELDEGGVEFKHISDDIAAVAYKVTTDGTAQGKTVNFEGFDTSIWVRRGDTWVCAVHTETPFQAAA
jgi:ketosteroid isomerase-like protein